MRSDRRTVEIRLRSDPAAIAHARRALRGIGDAVPDDVLDEVRLLVSELVTNSVRHAGRHVDDPIEVAVRVDRRVVHAEVSDRGPGFTPPMPRTPGTVAGSGWGLYLVERIADRWGARSDDGGSCVWFEIDLP